MADPKPHQLISCPYNKAHQVEYYRMHVHIQKCRKQHKDAKKVVCPFHAEHIVNDVELEYHVSICDKREIFDRQLYSFDTETKVNHLPPPVVQTEENWDDENLESYKPDPAKMGSHILVKAKGMTPSERRKVRELGIRNYKPLQD